MSDQKQCKNCERLEKELNDLKELLTTLGVDVHLMARDCAKEMAAGNVPRGRWAYIRGRFDMCNEILEKMGLSPAYDPEARTKKDRLGASLFSGLFGGLNL